MPYRSYVGWILAGIVFLFLALFFVVPTFLHLLETWVEWVHKALG